MFIFSCNKKNLCLLLITFILSQIAIAQAGTGKLSGKVSDSSSNQSLFGVSIMAKGSSKGVASITDGSYILTLTPGTYTIRYSYSGYKTKDIYDVIIKKGETNFLDVLMAAKGDLQTVVVTGQSARQATQSAVYNRQKLLAASSDAIGAIAMSRTPDANAGQAVARVPGINVKDNRFVVVRGLGDQYNQTMLNGVPMTSTESNRNAFALDLIPTAVLDNITVVKTATPDLPGNFAGGIVQINTKDFPANDFYSIVLGAGFSDQTIGKNFFSDSRQKSDIIAGDAKSRRLPDNFPTSANLLSLNVIEQHRYLRMLKNNLAPVNNGPSGPNENIQLGFGKTLKFANQSQAGIVLAVTQRKTELIENEINARDPEPSKASYFPGSQTRGATNLIYYANTNRYKYSADFGGVLNLAYSFGKNKITFKNLYSQILKNNYTERPEVVVDDNGNNGFPLGGKDLYGITYFIEQKRIINSILAGEHRTGNDNNTRLDWNINTTLTNTNTPDTRNFLYSPDKTTGILSLNSNQSSTEAALQQNSRVWSKDKDFIYGGAFNISTNFNLFKTKQIFKTGLLFQNRDRKSTANTIIYQGVTGVIDSLLAVSQFYSSDRNSPGVSLFTGTAASNGTYNSGSSLLATYLSMESRLGEKWRIIWGVRAEKYQQYVNVFNPYYYANFSNYDLNITGVTARTTFNFLPSVNVVYALTKKINIRGAYSQTAIRPELKDLADFIRYDYQSFMLSSGNPQLRSTGVRNYDFKFEIFPSAGEIISFSAFYKSLRDPIEYVRNANYYERLLQPLNVGNAYVRGLEAEIRKKIDFIPVAPWLKNIMLFGNGTILQSRVPTQVLNDFFFPKIVEHTLTGQPGYIINAGITINAFKNSFEATASFNRTGVFIYQLGSADKLLVLPNGQAVLTIPNSKVNPRNVLDLTISQDLFKNKCKIKINVSNILNSRYIVFQDVNDNGKFDEPYSLQTNSGIDTTPSSLNGQRTYTFSVGYTFQ